MTTRGVWLVVLLIGGCAGSPPPAPPFGATWYMVQPRAAGTGKQADVCAIPYEPMAAQAARYGGTGNQTAGTIHLALLNQSDAECTIDQIEINGPDDRARDSPTAATSKGLESKGSTKKIGGRIPPGRVLVLPVDDGFSPPLCPCSIPVRIVVHVVGEVCKVLDGAGTKKNPQIILRAGFPNYLPGNWEEECAQLGILPRE